MYNWQDQMTPPDLIGGGIDNDLDNSSLIGSLKSMQGNMPSQALMQMAMNQPQGNPFMEALAGGVALMNGRPNPVSEQNARMAMQQNQMFQNVMKIQSEERQMAIAQANMAMAQRRQTEIERQNAIENDFKRADDARLKDEQNFRRADRDLTLAQHFMASEDPTTRKQAGPLFSSAYKTLGKEEPTALIQSLASPNPPKKESLLEAQKMINAGMDNDAVMRQIPGLSSQILDDTRKVLQQPGAAEKLGLKSEKDLEKQDLDIAVLRAKVWEQKYGITDVKLGDATAAELNKMGKLPEQATSEEVIKARALAQAKIDADELRKESQKASMMLARQKELAQFTASLKEDKPMTAADSIRLGKEVGPISANMEMTEKVKTALGNIPADAFPEKDDILSGAAAALRRSVKYPNNDEWRKFSTFIIPKLIGFDRSVLDDIGQKSIKAFGPALDIIEGRKVPSRASIEGIVDIIAESEKRKANLIFNRLVTTRQPQDAISFAREALGPYLDSNLVRSSGTPLQPQGMAVPVPRQSPLGTSAPRIPKWSVEKGDWE